MLARDLMTPNPVPVDLNASTGDAWDIMRENEIRHVPVVEGGVLVGMRSDRALAPVDVGRILAFDGAAAARAELARPVIDRMSIDVVSVHPENDASGGIALLL